MPGPIRPFRPSPTREFKSKLLGVTTMPRVDFLDPNMGTIAGGTAVTIHGDFFRVNDGDGSAPIVTFQDALGVTVLRAINVVVVDGQTITCIAPTYGVSGAVTVTVTVGTEVGLQANAFTYYDVAVKAITPNNGPFGGGTIVIIEGYNFEVGSTVTFGGEVATSVSVLDTRHIKVTAPAHATGYADVVVTGPSGSIATLRNGFQFTLFTRGKDIRRTPGIIIHDTLNNSPNTCTFTVDGQSIEPVVGEKIQILDEFDDDRLLFAGTIQSSELIYEGQIDQIAWRVNAVDFTWLMNRRRPFGRFVNVSASEVVKSLITSYAPGFSTTFVQTNLAKISITLDGLIDLSTVLSNIAAMIGGGHWYVDYNQSVHFFHTVSSTLASLILTTKEPPAAPITNIAHITIAESTAIPSTFSYTPGYLLVRHSFVFSDGSESVLGAISNILQVSGTKILSLTGIPLGTDPGGGITCVGRRLYYTILKPSALGDSPIEVVSRFCAITDNTTTAFTTWFGSTNPSVATVTTIEPKVTFETPIVATPSGMVQLSDQAAALNLTGAVSNGPYGLLAGPTYVPPPTSPSFLVQNGSTAAMYIGNLGYAVGDTLLFALTASRYNGGETSISDPISYTTVDQGYGAVGPILVAPAIPSNANYMSAYVSFDGGATYHRWAATVYGNQRLPFSALKSFILTTPAPPAFPGTLIASAGARGWVGYNGASIIPTLLNVMPQPSATVIYYASPDVASDLEARVTYVAPPKIPVTTHATGPATGPSVTQNIVSSTPGQFSGGLAQFKIANIFRDGSVSFPSPASSDTGLPYLINGTGLIGYNFVDLPIGRAVNGLEVVGRFVYYCNGQLTLPGSSSQITSTPLGTVWPYPIDEPAWIPGTSNCFMVVPDNTTKQILNASPESLGSTVPDIAVGQTPIAAGKGNRPFINPQVQQLSTDPIPIWPNPDGPDLEGVDPPNPLTEDNLDLLHEDSGSQPFSVHVDASQVRNRVYVGGSGTIAVSDAIIGAKAISVADITAMSPNGGKVRIIDGSGIVRVLAYSGIQGQTGSTSISLTVALDVPVVQGSTIQNWFQADDLKAQEFLAKIELDVNGNTTDGIHETTIIDTSLKSTFQLFMRAYAELELFAMPIVTIRYSTRDPKTKSGQFVHVDLDHPPCQGDFLIQDVTIDQIHDESDQLSPRYTVSASSVKFELNDLLLQIIGGNLAGGSSDAGNSAGIAASAASSAATDRGNLSKVTTRSQLAAFINQNSFVSIPVSSFSLSGGSTGSFVTDTVCTWNRATNNSPSVLTAWGPNSANHCWIEHLPYFQVKLRTGPAASDVAGILIFVTIGETVSAQNNTRFQASGVSQRAVGVRFSASANDGGFRPFTNNGSAGVQSMYPLLVSMAPATVYLITIEVLSTLLAKITVNGISTNVSLPGSMLSTILGPEISFWTEDTITAGKRLDFNSAFFDRL